MRRRVAQRWRVPTPAQATPQSFQATWDLAMSLLTRSRSSPLPTQLRTTPTIRPGRHSWRRKAHRTFPRPHLVGSLPCGGDCVPGGRHGLQIRSRGLCKSRFGVQGRSFRSRRPRFWCKFTCPIHAYRCHLPQIRPKIQRAERRLSAVHSILCDPNRGLVRHVSVAHDQMCSSPYCLRVQVVIASLGRIVDCDRLPAPNCGR